MQIVLVVCIICIFIIPMSVAGQILSPDRLDLINRGMASMLGGHWQEAYDTFSELHLTDSNNPAGYLFRAGVLQAEMIDREENLYSKELKALLDSVEMYTEERMKLCSREDSAIYYLYLGHAYAYRSLREARFGSKLSALSDGFKAKGRYMDGLKTDSTLHDLFLGLGSYHYWKTVKAGILRTFGIFKNDRQKGIDEIQLAAESSLFSKDAAQSALIWIMINDKEYDTAIEMSKTMIKKYPDALSFYWPLAQSYYRNENYEKASDIYRIILDRQKQAPGNYYNLIEAVHGLYFALDKSGENGKAYSVLQYLDSVYTDIPKNTRHEQRSKLWSLRRRGR